MKRVMLTVAYDGTNYHGWQLQPNVTTIESVLNGALSALLKEETKVIGASRTDTGVHALGNIAVFDTQARMPAEKFAYALNQRLPEDIRIQDARRCRRTFTPGGRKAGKHMNTRSSTAHFRCPCTGFMRILRMCLSMSRPCGGRRRIWWERMILRASAV